MQGEVSVSFFFQAEDGIRDTSVTGVQTCALPIFLGFPDRYLVLCGRMLAPLQLKPSDLVPNHPVVAHQIGRASCRKGVDLGGRRITEKKNKHNKKQAPSIKMERQDDSATPRTKTP